MLTCNRVKELKGRYYTVIEDLDQSEIPDNDDTSDSDAAASVILYDNLVNNSECYKDLYVAIICKVLQVDEIIKDNATYYLLRVAQDSNITEIWTAACLKTQDTPLIFKGDMLTLYGKFDNSNCGVDTQGNIICKPCLEIYKLDLSPSIDVPFDTMFRNDLTQSKSIEPKKSTWGI